MRELEVVLLGPGATLVAFVEGEVIEHEHELIGGSHNESLNASSPSPSVTTSSSVTRRPQSVAATAGAQPTGRPLGALT